MIDKRDSEEPGRRSTDMTAEELTAFVERTKVFMRRVFIGALISLSVIALTTSVALVGLGVVVRYNHDQAVKVEELARKADDRSQDSLFESKLAKEKVCSQSSDRRVACQALFERLAGALSEEQRLRLACQVVLHLKGKTARTLRKDNPQCKELPP